MQTAKSAWGTNCLEPPAEPSSTPLNRDLCLYTFNYLDHGLAIKSGLTWNSLFTLYVQDYGTWFAITPENRYETKVADTPGLQWLTPARPLNPLPVQTYMRNLYEPGLMARLIDCNVVNRCAAAFKPLPNLSTLNWVLPSVSITRVKPGQEANTLDVTVEAKVGAYVSPRGVRTSSGIYDLQLFRNGKLVGQLPGARVVEEPNAAQSPATAACPWRPANRLAVGSGTLGCRDINWAVNPNARLEKTFTVAIASDPAADNIFSAYAFNEDRVKGDTFTYPNLTPRTPGPSDNQQIQQERADVSRARVGWSRRAPRAYVLAIGINAYDNRSWSLNFATTDAETIATRLRETGRLPGYSDVRTLALLAQADAGPDQPRATKTNICFALQLLARPTADAKPPDCDPRHPNTPNPLRGRGFEPASPDDVVVISFSGHGWAEESNQFYLVPSDGRMDAAGRAPDPQSLISSMDLTNWLRDVDAGESAIIIDACHAAASVATAGFKPGPFGDAGLGQLSFDKGIRILTAAQADGLAMEDPGLRQGLLTYALVREGLGDPDPQADRDLKAPALLLGADQRLSLDAWLSYAAQRLPALSRAVVLRRMSPAEDQGELTFDPPTGVAPVPAQEPSLFDFTGKASRVSVSAKGSVAGPRR